MEDTALLFRLLMFEFILLGTQVQDSYTHSSDADFLRISPNRLQHFQLDSVSFDCGGFDGSTQLKGIKKTKIFDPKCDIKSTPTGSICIIDSVYAVDSGVYWCETAGGKRSNRVNITVTVGSVILDIPASPVTEGEKVTLLCRDKHNSNNLPAHFYKDRLLKYRSAKEMTIYSVSRSDEGLYMCSIPGVGASPGSWLAVRAPDKKTVSENTEVPLVSDPLWVAVIILVTALVLLVVGFLLYIWKHRVPADDVTDPDSVTYAVVTGQKKDKAEDESSCQPVYSTLTISQAPRAAPPAGSGLSSSTVNLNPAASGPKETGVIYSSVQTATKSRDT